MPLFSTFATSSIRAVRSGIMLLPPNVPTSFTATGVSADNDSGGAVVTFTAPDTEAGLRPVTSYQVENQSTGAITTVTSGATVSLAKNTTQTFRVRAVNSAGTSAWSSTDTALSFRQTYGPDNGAQYVVYIPAGTSVGYSMLSGAGSSSIPDTRTYGNVYSVNNWYTDYNLNQEGPYYANPVSYGYRSLGNYIWDGYHNNVYVQGIFQYAGFSGYPGAEYWYGKITYGYDAMGLGYNTTIFAVTANQDTGQTGGDAPQSPDYGGATYMYHNNESTQVAITAQGYNLTQASLSGSFTLIGSYMRIYTGSYAYYGGRPVQYYGPAGSARIWYGT